MPKKTRSGAGAAGHSAAEGYENGLAEAEGEFIKAAIGLGGGAFAKEAVPVLSAYIRSQGPVLHSVLASWFEGKSHFAVLEFRNISGDGAYIESLAVASPADDIDCMFAVLEERGTPLAYWKKQSAVLPLLVPAQGKVRLALRFAGGAAGTLAGAELVTLAYELTPANGATTCRKELAITLRRSGPAYGRVS